MHNSASKHLIGNRIRQVNQNPKLRSHLLTDLRHAALPHYLTKFTRSTPSGG